MYLYFKNNQVWDASILTLLINSCWNPVLALFELKCNGRCFQFMRTLSLPLSLNNRKLRYSNSGVIAFNKIGCSLFGHWAFQINYFFEDILVTFLFYAILTYPKNRTKPQMFSILLEGITTFWRTVVWMIIDLLTHRWHKLIEFLAWIQLEFAVKLCHCCNLFSRAWNYTTTHFNNWTAKWKLRLFSYNITESCRSSVLPAGHMGVSLRWLWPTTCDRCGNSLCLHKILISR